MKSIIWHIWNFWLCSNALFFLCNFGKIIQNVTTADFIAQWTSLFIFGFDWHDFFDWHLSQWILMTVPLQCYRRIMYVSVQSRKKSEVWCLHCYTVRWNLTYQQSYRVSYHDILMYVSTESDISCQWKFVAWHKRDVNLTLCWKKAVLVGTHRCSKPS